MLRRASRLLCSSLLLAQAVRGLQTAVPRATKLVFEPPTRSLTAKKLLLCGRKDALLSDGVRQLLPDQLSSEMWQALVESCDAGEGLSGGGAAGGGGAGHGSRGSSSSTSGSMAPAATMAALFSSTTTLYSRPPEGLISVGSHAS